MPFLAKLRSLLRLAISKDRLESDLDAELQSYAQMLTDRHVQNGMSPDAARHAALLEIGGSEQVKEKVRDARVGAWLDGFLRDLRYSVRSLTRSPGFTSTVVVTLALGIGALTAIASVTRAVLLEPLPYPESDRLYFVWSDLDKAGYSRAPLSGPELQDLRERSRNFEQFGAIWTTTLQLVGEGDPEQIEIGRVTANFFSTLGVLPALGRDFLAAEEGEGAPSAIVLSWALWQRRYGGDPDIVGRRIRTGDGLSTVVGVMPQNFRLWFPKDANVPEDLQAWIPFPETLSQMPRGLYYLRTFGRTWPATSTAAAAAELQAITRDVVPIHEEYSASGRSFYSIPLKQDSVREIRPALLALLGCVALVLLIAVSNVASLLIGRAMAHRKEAALLMTFGASRKHLARHFLAQGLILSASGGVAGLGLGWLGLQALLSLRPSGLGRIGHAGLDPSVLGLSAGVCALAAIVFSLTPLRVLLRSDLRASLQQEGRAASHRLGLRTRSALVVTEVALGIVLLVGAGLMARTLARLQDVDPGFRASGVLSFRIALPWERYTTAAALHSFSIQLEQKIGALPGVEAVGAISHVPLDRIPNWSTPYKTEAAGAEETMREADARVIGPGLFEAAEVPLLEGRAFQESDDERSQKVVIVDELLARRAWPGQSALGKRIEVQFHEDGDFVPYWATVVGVVRHIRHRSLTEEVREQVYQPYRQSPRRPVAYLVRSRQEPGSLADAIRAQVASLDQELPIYDVRPLSDYVTAAMSAKRFVMLLAGLFACVALVLASVGTYGLISYSVGQRSHEFAVRAALGARPMDIHRLVLREGLAWTAVGLAIGIPAAVLAASRLESLFYGVAALDPVTFLAVGLVQICVAFLACWIPARRATGAQALDALRVG